MFKINKIIFNDIELNRIDGRDMVGWILIGFEKVFGGLNRFWKCLDRFVIGLG